MQILLKEYYIFIRFRKVVNFHKDNTLIHKYVDNKN
jgi:hypothetical protein